MEDALVHNLSAMEKPEPLSLNPCFNGRCTRTKENYVRLGLTLDVLILVLMEDALVHLFQHLVYDQPTSLNPCFNGRCTRTS